MHNPHYPVDILKGSDLTSRETGNTKIEVSDRYSRVISKEEINLLALKSYQGPVRLIHNRDGLDSALAGLNRESVLGFDTETKPSFKKGVSYPPSLLQLAGSEEVFIFQLKTLGLPDELRDILARKGVLKSGVAVQDDIKELKQLAPFEEAGFVDLGDRARDLGLKTHGLRNLAANLLGYRISKQARVSNWASDNLTEKQIRYAATDAWVSREIYLAMEKLGFFLPSDE